MLCLMFLSVILLPPDDPPKPPRPAAMIVDLKGKVEIRPVQGTSRIAELEDLVYPGEKLMVPAEASATVSILGAGVKETLKPSSEATIGVKGCSPPESIAGRKEQPKSVASTMKGIRPAAGDSRKAGVGFRSGRAKVAIIPIAESIVAGDRPAFRWPSTAGATRYRLRVSLVGAEEPLWTLDTTSPEASYPQERRPLVRDETYSWTVTDDLLRTTAAGKFSVASVAELADFAEVSSLGASEDRADRLLAILCFKHLHAYQEAIELATALARRWPDEPAYRRVLDELIQVAGKAEAR